jgi:hypothetical protein
MHRAPKKKILEFWQPKAPVFFFFFEVNWLHGLDQATTNLLHKKIRREDGATCYDTHPTALFPQEMLSQGHADSSVRNSHKGHPGPDRVPNVNLLLLGPAHVTNILQKKILERR